MVIDRILNNNVVIIKDNNGKEVVVCGKGIAFKKKNGDEIDEMRLIRFSYFKIKFKANVSKNWYLRYL